MARLDVINQNGTKVCDIELSDAVFGIEPNQQAIFDAVVMQRASLRQGTHDTKTRSEVRGGGRKPWRQKGTGRARQGSINAPQWRHGGIVFGPTPRSYAVKVNRKVSKLAMKSALSYKVLNDKLIAVDTIVLNEIKTKDFVKVIESLNACGKTLFVLPQVTENVERSSRNIPTMEMVLADGINVYDIINANKVVFTEAAVKKVEEALQ